MPGLMAVELQLNPSLVVGLLVAVCLCFLLGLAQAPPDMLSMLGNSSLEREAIEDSLLRQRREDPVVLGDSHTGEPIQGRTIHPCRITGHAKNVVDGCREEAHTQSHQATTESDHRAGEIGIP